MNIQTIVNKFTQSHNKLSVASVALSAIFLVSFFLPVLSFGFFTVSKNFSLNAIMMNSESPFLVVAFAGGIISFLLSGMKLHRFVFLSAFISFVGVFLSLAGFVFMESTRQSVTMPVVLVLNISPLISMGLSMASWKPYRRARRLAKVELVA